MRGILKVKAEEIKQIKEKYTIGTKVKLIKMYDMQEKIIEHYIKTNIQSMKMLNFKAFLFSRCALISIY